MSVASFCIMNDVIPVFWSIYNTLLFHIVMASCSCIKIITVFKENKSVVYYSNCAKNDYKNNTHLRLILLVLLSKLIMKGYNYSLRTLIINKHITLYIRTLLILKKEFN